jgi:hypothetical protein
MAEDADRNGNACWSGTEVTPIGEPLLLPEAETELWKPEESSPSGTPAVSASITHVTLKLRKSRTLARSYYNTP